MALDEIIVLRQKLHRQQLEGWKNHYRLEERKGHTWYKNRALIVVGDEGDKRALLEVYHDAPSAGHPGVAKTLQSLSHNYWWPVLCSTTLRNVHNARLERQRLTLISHWCNPSLLTHRLNPFQLLPWILSLNCPSLKGTTQYSPLWTTTAPRWSFCCHVERKWIPWVWPNCT